MNSSFDHLDISRQYVLYKNNKVIFNFIVDSARNFKILTGNMKGYSIAPENQLGFLEPEFTIIDIGESPTVASIKVDTAKGRPRTPE